MAAKDIITLGIGPDGTVESFITLGLGDMSGGAPADPTDQDRPIFDRGRPIWRRWRLMFRPPSSTS